MPVNVKGSNFKPAPMGLWPAVCVDVVDLGDVKSTWQGETRMRHMVQFVWQIDARDPSNNKRFTVRRRYTASLHKKGNLKPDLEGWLGRQLTEQEAKGMDLERFLGENCQLQIIHDSRDGETYANVKAILPAQKGGPLLEPETYVRQKDRSGDTSFNYGKNAEAEDGELRDDVDEIMGGR